MQPSGYGRLTGDPRAIETLTGNPMTLKPLAVSKDAGIDDAERRQRWQTIATLPAERSEAHIAETKAAAEELTTAGATIYKQEHQHQQEPQPPPRP